MMSCFFRKIGVTFKDARRARAGSPGGSKNGRRHLQGETARPGRALTLVNDARTTQEE
jgi:hypothetical protein